MNSTQIRTSNLGMEEWICKRGNKDLLPNPAYTFDFVKFRHSRTLHLSYSCSHAVHERNPGQCTLPKTLFQSLEDADQQREVPTHLCSFDHFGQCHQLPTRRNEISIYALLVPIIKLQQQLLGSHSGGVCMGHQLEGGGMSYYSPPHIWGSNYQFVFPTFVTYN